MNEDTNLPIISTQAQAGEPLPVWNFGSDRENENGTVIVNILGSQHPATTDQFITLQSHREAMKKINSYALGYQKRWEEMADELDDAHEAIAKKDAALKACVEALESLFSGQDDPDRAKRCSDAIIQSKEALQ